LIIKKTLTPKRVRGQAPTLSLKKGEGALFFKFHKFPLLSEERNKACPEYIRFVQYKLHRRGEEFIKGYQNN
jgi:hypothetical protein